MSNDLCFLTPVQVARPGDNFDLEKPHVLPATMRKIHLARLLEEDRWDRRNRAQEDLGSDLIKLLS
ncbi:hypothetical protein [Desulfonatronovibrio magnus]|uniref:hypothetical protein n=1 Tax=Desulfonatronovibrio magnus TaxID=698827 RepID=UPI0005EBB120|nr:hypothetical protein [Desulfonatronovibrio magnus]